MQVVIQAALLVVQVRLSGANGLLSVRRSDFCIYYFCWIRSYWFYSGCKFKPDILPRFLAPFSLEEASQVLERNCAMLLTLRTVELHVQVLDNYGEGTKAHRRRHQNGSAIDGTSTFAGTMTVGGLSLQVAMGSISRFRVFFKLQGRDSNPVIQVFLMLTSAHS